jgi:anti-sigma B factor antagonist
VIALPEIGGDASHMRGEVGGRPVFSQEEWMEIEFRDIGEHKIIQVSGEVDLYNVSELKKALFSITDGKHHSIIVDMKNVNYMDSSGIGALVAGQKKMRAHNGRFALMNIHEDVLNILKLATLDRFFKIYESEDEII